jgi:hypothetical protein
MSDEKVDLPDVDLDLEELRAVAHKQAELNEEKKRREADERLQMIEQFRRQKTASYARQWLSKVVKAIKETGQRGERAFRVSCGRDENIHAVSAEAERRAAVDAAALVIDKLPREVRCEAKPDCSYCSLDESNTYYMVFEGSF